MADLIAYSCGPSSFTSRQAPLASEELVVATRKEVWVLMSDDLQSRPTDELRLLRHQCSETIETVCSRLGVDDEMAVAVRGLMRADDLLGEFSKLEGEDRETASRVLHAALAVLANSHTLAALNTELKRRATAEN